MALTWIPRYQINRMAYVTLKVQSPCPLCMLIILTKIVNLDYPLQSYYVWNSNAKNYWPSQTCMRGIRMGWYVLRNNNHFTKWSPWKLGTTHKESFLEEFEYGWERAGLHAHTWREGSGTHAQAMPGSNTLDLEPVTAGAFSLLFDLHILSLHPWLPITSATSWLFTLFQTSLSHPIHHPGSDFSSPHWGVLFIPHNPRSSSGPRLWCVCLEMIMSQRSPKYVSLLPSL